MSDTKYAKGISMVLNTLPNFSSGGKQACDQFADENGIDNKEALHAVYMSGAGTLLHYLAVSNINPRDLMDLYKGETNE